MSESNDITRAWAEVNGATEVPKEGMWVWIWGAIQGDFKEDRTLGQMGADMVISLIPGIDTICDIRDLCADIRAIRKEPSNKLLYFSLVLTLIGFIPELGTIVKSVVKIVFAHLRRYVRHVDDLWDTAKLTRLTMRAVDDALPKISRFLSHSNVVKWATRERVPDIYRFVAKHTVRLSELVDVAKIHSCFDRAVNAVEKLLKGIRYLTPRSTREKLDDFVDYLARHRNVIRDQLDEFVKPVRTILAVIAKKLDDHAWIAMTQTVNKGWIAPMTQQGAAVLMRKNPPKWVRVGAQRPHRAPSKDEAKDKALDLALEIEEAKLLGKSHPQPLRMDHIQSFEKNRIEMGTITGPAKLYRIVDPTSAGGGNFWIDEATFHSLKSRDDWRSQLAIKPEWNQNGSYVVYEIKHGETLDVWHGPVASQKLDDTPFHLEGGARQIVFAPIPDTMQFGKPRIDPDTGEVMHDWTGAVDHRFEFKDVTGATAPTPIRAKINDPHISGPFETGWGFAEWHSDPIPTIHVVVPPDM